MDTTSANPAAPPGFQPLSTGGAFIAQNGPFYLFHEGDVVKLGFRVEARHCNPANVCHGGMLASFADMLLPVTIQRKTPLRGGAAANAADEGPPLHVRGHFLPTVNLQIDYMAPAKLGDWVEGEAQVLKATVSMVFAQGLITSGGKLAVRCSGVFKIGPVLADLNIPRP